MHTSLMSYGIATLWVPFSIKVDACVDATHYQCYSADLIGINLLKWAQIDLLSYLVTWLHIWQFSDIRSLLVMKESPKIKKWRGKVWELRLLLLRFFVGGGFFFFSAVPWDLCDLSSLARDQTCVPCSGNRVVATGPPGTSQGWFSCHE